MSRLATASPSERASTRPLCRLAIAPCVAGAGVEQNADGREVDRDARPLDALGGERLRERFPAVDAARAEMAPAAVIGNAQVGIGGACHLRHVGGDGGEPLSSSVKCGERPSATQR